MIRAVLFDLDDTLVPEASAWERAFAAACADCELDAAVDVVELRRCVFKVARELWQGSPVSAWCRTAGIGSPSSLLSDFPGEGRELEFLRGWSPLYRITAWRAGLAQAGIRDAGASHALSDAFRRAFAVNHRPFDDVLPALDNLTGMSLAVITNGASDLQRAKLRVAGLERYFPAALISGELGFGKPDGRIFRLALDELGVSAAEAVMVGDSPERDIAGAVDAGLRALWLDRAGASETPLAPHRRIESLRQLADVLSKLG